MCLVDEIVFLFLINILFPLHFFFFLFFCYQYSTSVMFWWVHILPFSFNKVNSLFAFHRLLFSLHFFHNTSNCLSLSSSSSSPHFFLSFLLFLSRASYLIYQSNQQILHRKNTLGICGYFRPEVKFRQFQGYNLVKFISGLHWLPAGVGCRNFHSTGSGILTSERELQRINIGTIYR